MPSIKIGEYAPRNPKQQFYLPATEPLPNGSELHGGRFYDLKPVFDKYVGNRKIFSSVAFQRNVRDKRKDMSRIEQTIKATKIDTDANGKIRQSVLKKKVARENKEIMFDLIWGPHL